MKKLIDQFLSGLSSRADPDLETAFLVGRELSSIWPSNHFEELKRGIAAIGSHNRVGVSFIDGLTSSSVHKSAKITQPALHEVEHLLTEIKKSGVSRVSDRVRSVMARHLAYAEATGFTMFLANAAAKLASAVLKRPQNERFESGVLSQAFLRESLRWEPWNSFLWQLWADSYLAQGARDPAEIILWEATRRFPDQKAVIGRLIRLIGGDQRRVQEALDLSAEAIGRFPHDIYLKNMRAHLLIRERRPAEALELLIINLLRSPNHDASITLFARGVTMAWIAIETFQTDDLKSYISRIPRNSQVLGKIGRSLQQQNSPSNLIINFYRISIDIFPGDAFLKNALANQLLKSSSHSNILAARKLFEEVIEGDDENAYALEGLARAEIALTTEISPPELAERDQAQQIKDIEFNISYPAHEVEVTDNIGSVSQPKIEELWPPLPSGVARLGQVRRISFRLEAANENTHDAALEELKKFLLEDPTFAYAQLLAVRQGLWDRASDGILAFPAAFERALAEQDVVRLRDLGNSHPRLKVLTLAARALYGDAEAAKLLLELTAPQEKRPGLEEKVIRLVSANAVSGNSPFVAPRERVLEALRDLNEWALSGGPERAAA